jgi:hypothetical protein
MSRRLLCAVPGSGAPNERDGRIRRAGAYQWTRDNVIV